jgi:hypothetical protein
MTQLIFHRALIRVVVEALNLRTHLSRSAKRVDFQDRLNH